MALDSAIYVCTALRAVVLNEGADSARKMQLVEQVQGESALRLSGGLLIPLHSSVLSSADVAIAKRPLLRCLVHCQSAILLPGSVLPICDVLAITLPPLMHNFFQGYSLLRVSWGLKFAVRGPPAIVRLLNCIQKARILWGVNQPGAQQVRVGGTAALELLLDLP